MIYRHHIPAKLSTVWISLFFACPLCQIVTRSMVITQSGSSFQAKHHYEVVYKFSETKWGSIQILWNKANGSASITFLGSSIMKLRAIAYCLPRSPLRFLISFAYSCLSKTGHHTQTRLGDMTIAFTIREGSNKLETATSWRGSLICL